MLIYGTKTIDLKTIDLPFACINCGHDHQRLQISRKFLSLYYIPLIPHRKKGIVNCPGCRRELREKTFLEELASRGLDPMQAKLHLKSILKATKTPLYMYASPLILVALVVGFFVNISREIQQNKLLAKEYLQNPFGNVIAVIKSEGDAYPYQITYIPEIRDEEVVIFQWKYSYELLGDADRGVNLAQKSIKENKIKANFVEPYIVSVEGIKSVDIVSIHVLHKTIDWRQFVPAEDPEKIMKTFTP